MVEDMLASLPASPQAWRAAPAPDRTGTWRAPRSTTRSWWRGAPASFATASSPALDHRGCLDVTMCLEGASVETITAAAIAAFGDPGDGDPRADRADARRTRRTRPGRARMTRADAAPSRASRWRRLRRSPLTQPRPGHRRPRPRASDGDQALQVPSESMSPTLEAGDRILASRVAYAVSPSRCGRHRGVRPTRELGTSPTRGVCVPPSAGWRHRRIRGPSNQDALVKRIIGFRGRPSDAARPRGTSRSTTESSDEDYVVHDLPFTPG